MATIEISSSTGNKDWYRVFTDHLGSITSLGNQEEISLSQWVKNLRSRGRYAFSLKLLADGLPGDQEVTANRALSSLF